MPPAAIAWRGILFHGRPSALNGQGWSSHSETILCSRTRNESVQFVLRVVYIHTCPDRVSNRNRKRRPELTPTRNHVRRYRPLFIGLRISVFPILVLVGERRCATSDLRVIMEPCPMDQLRR
jgi:hypothetical protein